MGARVFPTLVLVVLAGAAVLPCTHASSLSSPNITALFEAFVEKHARAYTHGSSEWEHRLKVFEANVLRALEKTAEARAHGDTATYGINKYTDLTDAEFAARFLRNIAQTHSHSRTRRDDSPLATPCASSPVTCRSVNVSEIVPDQFDWRQHGAITGVYNQGECGGCWAFSAVETLESAWVIAGNKPVDGGHLSVQQVISCASNNYQCVGGWIWNAMEFIWELGTQGSGVCGENVFGFACREGCHDGAPACPASFPTDTLASFNSTCHCDSWSEQAMRVFIAKYGPLAVKVDADAWRDYTGGIVRYHCSSFTDSGDHAVQLVGYSVDNTHSPPLPYWIVRNSWGDEWGESGYIRLYRGANVCGIANDVNFGFASPPSSRKS